MHCYVLKRFLPLIAAGELGTTKMASAAVPKLQSYSVLHYCTLVGYMPDKEHCQIVNACRHHSGAEI